LIQSSQNKSRESKLENSLCCDSFEELTSLQAHGTFDRRKEHHKASKLTEAQGGKASK